MPGDSQGIAAARQELTIFTQTRIGKIFPCIGVNTTWQG
jgi:hypothetical protein